jgi:curved DNA-binding protein CbpA
MIYHPDKLTGNSEKFMKIKTAYETLLTPDTTKIHHQHHDINQQRFRGEPYIRFQKISINSKGDCEIDVNFKNIIGIYGIGELSGYYYWTTFKYNGGIQRNI